MPSNFRETLDELRNNHDRVVVFTQNQDVIWDYLLNTTGRFNVGVNPLYWDRREDKKIILGTLLPGYKIGLNVGCGGDVGLDCPSTELVFTCNPFFPILKNDGILKDEFRFAPLHQKLNFRPLDAVNQYNPLAIKFSSFNDMVRIHDFMTINQMPHSLESQDEEDVHLIRKTTRVSNNKSVFVDGPFVPEELLVFRKNKAIYLNHEMEFHYPDFLIVKELLKVFNDFPESGLSLSFLSFRTSISPKTIGKCLEFLVLSGCVRKAYQNNDHITIHKGYVPKPDKVFMLIPEGSHSVKTLMKRLNVPRETLIPLLKHYEGKGINFAFVPKMDEDIYVYQKPLTSEAYNKACTAIQIHLSFMSDWIQLGDKFLNQWLERKIEKHCLENSSQAVLFAVGQATLLNFKASQPDPLGP